MEKGYNSDVTVNGLLYHVQTEDWGRGNPYFMSRVYSQGAVVKSIKTAYAEVLPRDRFDDVETIRLAMKVQHQEILDLLKSGDLLES